MRALKLDVVVPQIPWLSTRESASANEKEGREVVASRLRRCPRLMFVNDVGDLALRATFGLNALVEEGRAESLSEEVNFEDDDVVTWDSK